LQGNMAYLYEFQQIGILGKVFFVHTQGSTGSDRRGLKGVRCDRLSINIFRGTLNLKICQNKDKGGIFLRHSIDQG